MGTFGACVGARDEFDLVACRHDNQIVETCDQIVCLRVFHFDGAAMTTSLPEELHLEILKRLLPSPQVLARASAVCKEWHRVVNDPGFLHELYRARGGAPVTLGFFHNFDDLHRRFVHVDAAGPAKFAFDSIDHKKRKWQFFDCRHGRVLLHDNWDRFLVWQPMTGDHHLVSYEGPFSIGGRHTGVALTCECAADDGGDDRGTPCNSSHFRLAVVSNHMRTDCLRASVFSSVTRKWTASPVLPLANQIRPEPCVIVGRTLYQPLLDYLVLEFDMDKRTLRASLICSVYFRPVKHE
ncbi:hypothetical protein QYE76_057938 [Lolium multiflorum]|uniref:F-box domain-containing protein n=1 Tax=Lolium multiflorum TaxID=4521 RepID=A0AAD8T5L5_LOLMU|nr:hypothetical protein QYE76_057938 [Lolium multiflorum]